LNIGGVSGRVFYSPSSSVFFICSWVEGGGDVGKLELL